jgi:hypothetical protein
MIVKTVMVVAINSSLHDIYFAYLPTRPRYSDMRTTSNLLKGRRLLNQSRRELRRRGKGNLCFERLELRQLLAADLAPALFFGGQSEAVVVSKVTGTVVSDTSFTTADTIFVDFGWGNFGDTSTVVPYNTQLRLNGTLISSPDSGPHGSFQGALLQDVNLGSLAAGDYTLQMTIDTANVVAESSESNNIAVKTFTVEPVGTHDFGDAPTAAQSGFAASYPTLLADGGARHGVLSGFQLGALKDLEADGRPNVNAIGDDIAVSDDDDGVQFDGSFLIGQQGSFDVFVTNSAGVPNPYLDVWVDFNRDGDWSDSGERVFSQAVTAGANSIPFNVPVSVSDGASYARFRLHNGTSGLTAGGLASDGEVEDYRIRFVTFGNWVEQGPRSTVNGQIRNVEPDNTINGALHTVLAHPTNPDILYAGGVNGGIWKTTNATATNPSWTPQTDTLPSLAIGAMAFDVTDATRNTLVAGTAQYSSFGGLGGTRGHVYRTSDGGATWSNPGSAGLSGENISGIAARGNTIVVSSSGNGGGILRSVNGGASFVSVNSGGLVDNDDVHDLVEDPTSPTQQRLYAGVVGKGIFPI